MVNSFDDLALAYLMALGTPYAAGEKVYCDDHYEIITGFDFDLSKGGLMAITDHGSKISDFDKLADGERRANIRRFFNAVC